MALQLGLLIIPEVVDGHRDFGVGSAGIISPKFR